MRRTKITEELEKQIIDYYLSFPMSYDNISNKFHISLPTIGKIISKYNIQPYSKTLIYNPYLYESYFENIDDTSKAYYLGLIIADGNVFNPPYSNSSHRAKAVSITLNDYDSYLLENFRLLVRSNAVITYDGRGASCISIKSDKMASDLSKYGIVERKSEITYLPMLEDSMMRHLIRGIFDGDGCIQAHQTNTRYKHALGFCGSKLLMEQIRDYLVNKLKITYVNVYTYKDRPLSMVTWGSINDIKRICDFMYFDTTIFMYRKYCTYIDFLNHYNLSL